MTVRALGASDLDAVERVHAGTFRAALDRHLVIGLTANGADLLGAFEGDDLVGYGLSFTGHDADRVYAYSQTVAVLPEAQGKGIGRTIKEAQRDAARANGLRRLRWVFDATDARNAHISTDVLGARIIRMHKDFYRDGTDRLLVDWTFDDEAEPVDWPVPDLGPGDSAAVGNALAVGVPDSPLAAQAVSDALAVGMVGVSCRRGVSGAAVYLFAAP